MKKEKKINVTNYRDRAEYKKEYNRLYCEQFKDYFENYRKQNKERFEINQKKFLMKRSGEMYLAFKEQIEEIENDLKAIKAKNKVLNEKINEALKKQMAGNDSK